MPRSKNLILSTVPDLPEIAAGDDLPALIMKALAQDGMTVEDGDIFVVAQKIVSKSEGRLVNLSTVTAGPRALELAAKIGKRPELVQLILEESNEVLRTRPGTIIVEHKSGFVCANAGIDHSNVRGPWGSPEDWVLLLPEDADHSAQVLREGFAAPEQETNPVLIIDSHGEPSAMASSASVLDWRVLPRLVDMRGKPDRFDYSCASLSLQPPDELAGGAS